MMLRFDTVQVYVDLEHSGQLAVMGDLHCQQSHTGEIFSFNYDETCVMSTSSSKGIWSQ
jgi:serine/threonine-protein kinase HipA